MQRNIHRRAISVFAVAALCAGAAAADTITTTSTPAVAPSMSEELLRLWQMRDAVDAQPQSVETFEGVQGFDNDPFSTTAPEAWRPESQEAPTAPSVTGVVTASGRSLTPNLDRLLQRSQSPLVPSDAPTIAPATGSASWGQGLYSKSGSNTLTGGKNNGKNNGKNGHSVSPGNNGNNHSGSNHYGGNSYNGGYNCSHSHNGPCGGQCGHPHCSNPGHNPPPKDDHHGGGGGGGGGGDGGGCNPPTPTPEPTTMVLFGGAAAVAAGLRRRRQGR